MDERSMEAFTIDIPEEITPELTITIDVSQALANRTAKIKALDVTLSKIAEEIEIASPTVPNIAALRRLLPAITTVATRAAALAAAIEQLLAEMQQSQPCNASGFFCNDTTDQDGRQGQPGAEPPGPINTPLIDQPGGEAGEQKDGEADVCPPLKSI